MGTPPPSRPPPPTSGCRVITSVGVSLAAAAQPRLTRLSLPPPPSVYSVPSLSQLGVGARRLSESLRGPLDLGGRGSGGRN